MAHGDFDTVLSPIPEDSSEEGHEYESRFSSFERIGRMICRCARHWAWEERTEPRRGSSKEPPRSRGA